VNRSWKAVLTIAALTLSMAASSQGAPPNGAQPKGAPKGAPKGGQLEATHTHGKIEKITKTDEEWKKILTPEQYNVLRKQGTERAWTGKLNENKAKGVYVCAACGLPLFSSDAKFDSGTGWPSFWQPIKPENIGTEIDRSFFSTRTEVHCARCGGHLGHVFPDGPKPTGLRYCMNSVSMDFKPAQ
jgi:peptide-methionine (R)-S-oxide reductase